MGLESVRVVAAVIMAENENGEPIIFATQRGYGDMKGGWEFPGGKVETRETPEEALKREIREELDTEISVGEMIDTAEYDYPAFHISMDCFICKIVSGDLVLKEHEAARWLTKDQLKEVDWLPADRTVIRKIATMMGGSACDEASTDGEGKKTAIVYYSQHHGNTKKLIDAIASKFEITMIDVTLGITKDLSEYDYIGFASGIFYGKFAGQVIEYAKKNLNGQGKKVFFLYTYGNNQKSYCNDIAEVVTSKGAEVIGKYGCFGYDTFGPFKLVGGLKKGHPNDEEIRGAVEFFEKIM